MSEIPHIASLKRTSPIVLPNDISFMIIRLFLLAIFFKSSGRIATKRNEMYSNVCTYNPLPERVFFFTFLHLIFILFGGEKCRSSTNGRVVSGFRSCCDPAGHIENVPPNPPFLDNIFLLLLFRLLLLHFPNI